MTRLTIAAAEKLKVRGITEKGNGKRTRQGGKERTRLEYHDGGGLYLIVQKSGHKSWALKYKRNGVSAKLTLGPYNAKGSPDGTPKVGDPLNLGEARTLATSIKLQRNRGIDPIAEKKQERYRRALVVQDAQRTKFALAAQDYVEQYCRDKKANRTWSKIARALGLDFQVNNPIPLYITGGLAERWQDTPVSEITRRDVIAVIDAARATAIPGRSPRTRGSSGAREREMINALSGMFRWLLKRDLVTSLPTLGLERPPSGERDRVLTADELRRLWAACDDGPFGRLIKLLMLTGQRTGEVSGMRWTELGEDTWTIPADRAKNKREHTVPLAPLVRELIRYDHGDHLGDLVFTTTGTTPLSGFSKMKMRLDTRLKLDKDWQLRDLRRTMVTGMAELGVQPHIIEAVVNHVSGHKGGIARVYNRAEYASPKRKALERWAAHVEAVIAGRVDKTVTEFARRA